MRDYNIRKELNRVGEMIDKGDREGLKRTFQETEYCSVKYAAGKAIGLSDDNLRGDINTWIKTLSSQLDATALNGWVVDEKSQEIPDLKKRMKAVDDLGELYRMSRSPDVKKVLRKCYLKNDDDIVRERAGEALGYSGFRVWVHELFKP